MITVELTETQIEHLNQGASLFGRCSMLLETGEGDPVFVVLTRNHRRGRPRNKAAESQAAAGAAGEPEES